VLLALCEAAGFSGRMIWLYGSDSISHHTVAEVFYDGKYHMVDPFYKLRYYLADAKIASVDDIIAGKTNAFNELPPTLQALYGKKYPLKIAKRTTFFPTVFNRISSCSMVTCLGTSSISPGFAYACIIRV